MSRFRSLLLAHHAGDSLAAKLAVGQFSEQVARRTENAIKIADVFSSTVGTMPELLGMVIKGSADMALPTNDRLTAYSTKFACINIPFIFDDVFHADRVLDGPFREWVAPDLEACGLTLLSTWDWGFRQFTTSKHPILTPEDFLGLKIRIPKIKIYYDYIAALGAIPTWIEYSRLYDYLIHGVVDGQENPLSVIASLGISGIQKHITIINYSYGTLIHVINRDRFNELTGEQKVIVKKESEKAANLMREMLRKEESVLLEKLAASGVDVVTPDTEKFKSVVNSIKHTIKAYVGAGNYNQFVDMVDRLR